MICKICKEEIRSDLIYPLMDLNRALAEEGENAVVAISPNEIVCLKPHGVLTYLRKEKAK